MDFDFAGLSPAAQDKLLHSTIVPRPIAWVSTQSAAGVPNLAPFSFFNVFSTEPPILGLGIGRRSRGGPKHTARNILDTGAFVINLVSHANRDAMNVTGADVEDGVDESVLAGLDMVPSLRVAPRRVAGSPVAIECQLHQSIELAPERYLILGRVVSMSIDDALILDAEKHYVDAPGLDLIARMHGQGWYSRTDHLFQMLRIQP